jgi:hypothetical protein
MNIKKYKLLNGLLMALTVQTATAEIVKFDLENVGVDLSNVNTLTSGGVTATSGGVTITITPSVGSMHVCTYYDTSSKCFQGHAKKSNVPLNPANVSGERFISTFPTILIDDAAPITFTFSEPIKSFGLTMLDMLENGGNDNVTLTLSGDGGSSVHSITGPQGSSGIDLDFAISSSSFDITTVTFSHNGERVYGGQYGIDDLYVEIKSEILVDIDITTGTFPNSINLCDDEYVSVAILGSEEFNVYDIVTSSLIFAGAKVNVDSKKDKNKLCSGGDVNNDGYDDLTCIYSTTDIYPTYVGLTLAIANGELTNSIPFIGVERADIIKDTCD